MRLAILSLFSFLMSCVGGNHSGPLTEFEGKPISSFTIVKNEKLDPTLEKRILANIHSRKGAIHTQDRINQDIKDLYNSGLIDDIEFFAKHTGNSVRVTAEVIAQ
jgi:outer membrane protein assembly factor BamA